MVAAVDEPPESGHAVEWRTSRRRVDGHRDQTVVQDDRFCRRLPIDRLTLGDAVGWARDAGASGRQPNPGTSVTRASTRRTGGWSILMRTTESGRAPSRV